MHEKIDWWLLGVIVAAAVSRALTSPGTFLSRMTIALASILFAFAFTPAVVEVLGLYYGKALSANVGGAVGASLAITAEPIIRHMVELARNPAAILGLVRGTKEVLQELFRK